MTQLTLKPIVKDMLERAGIKDVYDFPPSARDCACPVVIANETYEQTDLLDDCEYGNAKLEIVIVRETQDEAFRDLSKIVHTLQKTDWNRYDCDVLQIRDMTLIGLPKSIESDSSGMKMLKTELEIRVTAALY